MGAMMTEEVVARIQAMGRQDFVEEVAAEADAAVQSEIDLVDLAEAFLAASGGSICKLASLVDAKFPRMYGQKLSTPDDPCYVPSAEAVLSAVDALICAWQGWLHQSKAIEPFGSPHPKEIEILETIMLVKQAALTKGRQRAQREKRVQGGAASEPAR